MSDRTLTIHCSGSSESRPLAASVLWATAQLACVLAGHGFVPLPVGALPGVMAGWSEHLGDPRQAFQQPARGALPGAALAYTSLVLCVTAASATGWLTLRHLGGNSTPGTMSGRKEIRDQLSLQSVRRRARQTRPSIDARRAEPSAVGLHLGREVKTGIELYGSVEDSYLYLGPPRSGKNQGVAGFHDSFTHVLDTLTLKAQQLAKR